MAGTTTKAAAGGTLTPADTESSFDPSNLPKIGSYQIGKTYRCNIFG
jgi:hypothetical protein